MVVPCTISLPWRVGNVEKTLLRQGVPGVRDTLQVYNLGIAEAARVGGPFTEADSHHVGDDAAHVALLRRVVVWPGVVTRHRHRPCLVAGVQLRQETRRVVDIAARIEHVLDAAELVAMIAVIDLHAAEIDERLAFAPRVLEGDECLGATARKNGFPFYIQRIRL